MSEAMYRSRTFLTPIKIYSTKKINDRSRYSCNSRECKATVLADKSDLMRKRSKPTIYSVDNVVRLTTQRRLSMKRLLTKRWMLMVRMHKDRPISSWTLSLRPIWARLKRTRCAMLPLPLASWDRHPKFTLKYRRSSLHRASMQVIWHGDCWQQRNPKSSHKSRTKQLVSNFCG